MPWRFWRRECVSTAMAWLLLCTSAVLYINMWYLLIGVLVAVNLLLIVLTFYSALTKPSSGFKLIQVTFDTLWTPFLAMFNHMNVHLTEPNLQGGGSWLPWDRGIPPWVRRQAFVISTISLTSDSPNSLILCICWIAFIHSVLLVTEELWKVEDYGNSRPNSDVLSTHTAVSLSAVANQTFDRQGESTLFWFLGVHAIICAALFSYICSAMSIVDVVLMSLFVCAIHREVQKCTMNMFKSAYPYILDGLGELAVLGMVKLVDLLACGRLFFLAFCDEHISLLLVSVTYCNTIAALMEFRIQVWLRLRNERYLVQCMRWASQQELMSHNDVCAICLAHMTSARVTACQHMFHGKCLRLSLNANSHCPLCKAALVPAFGHGHMGF